SDKPRRQNESKRHGKFGKQAALDDHDAPRKLGLDTMVDDLETG
ncbi:MAG: hypothetical protein RJA81_424, partial [Planctomycetota bacterium]